MSFTDSTFELFVCFSAISSLFKSSDCKSSFGGLSFFPLIFILKGKARLDICVLAVFKFFYLNHEQSLYLVQWISIYLKKTVKKKRAEA